jgi:hypothetical protein
MAAADPKPSFGTTMTIKELGPLVAARWAISDARSDVRLPPA